MSAKASSIFFGEISRRKTIFSTAVAMAGLALGSPALSATLQEDISKSEEAIHQEPMFKASRQRVYEALTAAAQFDKVVHLGEAMSGNTSASLPPTQIDREVGGTFTIFGGHITGRHLELLPNERIVQAWRVVDWKPGIFSIARFQLADEGVGTKIFFDHTGFPKGLAEHLASGWRGNYWEPLAKFLAS
jgi:uncharacterized protein YndB with AHSA1/START domain